MEAMVEVKDEEEEEEVLTRIYSVEFKFTHRLQRIVILFKKLGLENSFFCEYRNSRCNHEICG